MQHQYIKAVPGRKTYVKDAEWFADLLQHGLLQASFVPPRPQRELRELTRYRSSLAADRTRLVNRIQKTLEDTNIKLASVATDIMGKSARAILEALLAGEQNPQHLAELAQGRMKGKREHLVEALQGTLTAHHHFLLTSQLRQVDFLASQVQELDQEIARRLGLQNDPDEHEPVDSVDLPLAEEETLDSPGVPVPPDLSSTSPHSLSHAEAIRILDEVPGINVHVGAIVIAELGLEMDRFPDEVHLASWVGLCPAAKISANKRLSTKVGNGN